ncbi:MAG: flagellar biosynthesis protein FlhB, partial [Phycisphaerales bacterium JB039]
MAEQLGEKTEQPTARRRQEARLEGQVARSQDLSAAVTLAAGLATLLVLGAMIARTMAGVMAAVLEGRAPGTPWGVDSIAALSAWAAERIVWMLLPAMVILAAVGYLAQVAQVGFTISARPLTPKLSRLNPIAGAKRIFGVRGLVKTALNVVKLGVVTLVSALVVQRRMPDIITLPLLDLRGASRLAGVIILELVLWLLALMLVIGLIDFLYQRWQHTRDLRMTREEVKEERKGLEGDPQMKARRLRMAQKIALQQIRQAVPSADVVVTNPTHFAVAIKYDARRMRAPKVVAKGADALAGRMREIAALSSVPII